MLGISRAKEFSERTQAELESGYRTRRGSISVS